VDSLVTLALMRKAQLAFELDSNFMSFPLTPRAYGQSDFGFVQLDLTPEQWVLFREFSDMVDQIPRGPMLDQSSDERLSSVYTDVLRGGEAQLAASTRTDAEETEYEAALGFLYVTGNDGVRAETPTMMAYRQYRDAWFALKLDINNRKIDAQYATDPAIGRRWVDVEEPALQQQLADLERDWLAKGFRAEVEKAQLLMATLGAKSPNTEWDAWRARCLDDIDRPTDPKWNQQFWPSGFSPSNVFDVGGWTPFTLRGDTVESLANEAPGGLRGKLSDQVNVEIETLSFDCTSVRVERSWFTSDLFGARFWRLPDSAVPVSTGTSLDQGRCPSYIAAVILARRVAVTLKPQSQQNLIALEKYRNASMRVGGFVVRPIAPAGSDRIVLSPALTSLSHASPVVGASAAPARTPAGTVGGRMMVGRRVLTQPAARFTAHPAASATPAIAGRALREMKVISLPTRRRPTAPSSPPTIDPAVYVLGFICKRVPMSPNPDLSLQW
jgi:hypothetical protein